MNLVRRYGQWIHLGNHNFHRHELGGIGISIQHLAGSPNNLLYRWEITRKGQIIQIGHTRSGIDGQGQEVYKAAMKNALDWVTMNNPPGA